MKWNIVDRVSSQLLYALTGVILANKLTDEDFGLVGAILVFQAFASLFVDSGFSYALIQRKDPTREDYSTVFWFNLAVACAAYAVLFAAAPLIAMWFGEGRLVVLSRVMFLSFILSALAIVQTNRLMKRMDVKMVAVANSLGLMAGAVVGIYLACTGWGAWAVVWQTIVLNAVKSAVLWATSHWTPLWSFSWARLRGFFAVGSGMMASSFLNVLFLNIYSFFIGLRAGLAPLGYYHQADKWSKMGISSISQVITSTFLPALSAVQDEPERFSRISARMNRFTAYLVMPCMCFLAVMATPIFHLLFGSKWDPSIILFQLLLVRGIFTALNSLYNNYLVAKAHTRTVVWMEALRDGLALLFLLATLPVVADTRPGNPVWGIEVLLWGQLIASAVTWVVMTRATAVVTGRTFRAMLADLAPYIAITLAISAVLWWESTLVTAAFPLLLMQCVTALALYLAANALLGSAIQREVLAHIFPRRQ